VLHYVEQCDGIGNGIGQRELARIGEDDTSDCTHIVAGYRLARQVHGRRGVLNPDRLVRPPLRR
jgi:hypothetical protein